MAAVLPPGLEGFVAAQQNQRQQTLQNLGVLQKFVQMEEAKRKATLENQFRTEIGSGPFDPEKAAQAAIRAGRPDLAVQFHNQIEARKSRELIAEQNRIAVQERTTQAESLRRELAAQAESGRNERAQSEERLRRELAAAMAANRPEPAPIVQTDEQGRTRIFNRQGGLIKDLGSTGKPGAQIVKERMAQAKMNRDLSMVIPTLEDISKEGGLLDQATGSGIGAGVDIAASMFGYGTPGAIAIGKLKPATDAILKLVPRFEGPQSDKDTKSYQDAAGNLANPSTPNSVKKEAAKTILKLYKDRQGQFVTKDYESLTGSTSAPAESGWKDL